MLSQINQLVTSIVVVIVLATFLELLLPSGSLRRYVRLVIGFMILLLILNPIVQLLENDFMINPDRLDETHEQKHILELEEILERGEAMIDMTQKEIEQEYEQGITQKINAKVDTHFNNYQLAKVDLDYQSDPDSNDFGRINNLDIYLEGQNKEEGCEDREKDTSITQIEPVKTIEIDLSNDKGESKEGRDNTAKQNNYDEIDQVKLEEFLHEVSETFYIEEKYVTVQVMS